MQPKVPAVTWKLAAVSHSVTLHACGPIQQYYARFPVDRLKKKKTGLSAHIYTKNFSSWLLNLKLAAVGLDIDGKRDVSDKRLDRLKIRIHNAEFHHWEDKVIPVLK